MTAIVSFYAEDGGIYDTQGEYYGNSREEFIESVLQEYSGITLEKATTAAARLFSGEKVSLVTEPAALVFVSEERLQEAIGED